MVFAKSAPRKKVNIIFFQYKRHSRKFRYLILEVEILEENNYKK